MVRASCGSCQWFRVSVEWFEIIPVSKGYVIDDGYDGVSKTLCKTND